MDGLNVSSDLCMSKEELFVHSGLWIRQKRCFRTVKIIRGRKCGTELLRSVKKMEGK